VHDAIIIGGGPAGLSAALVLGRCRRDVLLLDAGRPRNAVTQALHGFLTRDGASPRELIAIAREQLGLYASVELRAGTAVSCCRSGSGFEVRTEDGRSELSRMLILATGKRDELPEVPGLRELYGHSVFHCPYCDGFEVRDRALAAYSPRHAGLALELLGWSGDVVLCTDGAELSDHELRALAGSPVRVETRRLARLEGEGGRLRRLVYADGTVLARDALFFSSPQEQGSSLAEMLGCRIVRSGAVATDELQLTTVPGVWVVGDASPGEQLAIIAAAEGARAAIDLHKALGPPARSVPSTDAH
jgi:thioredoxin reductase